MKTPKEIDAEINVLEEKISALFQEIQKTYENNISQLHVAGGNIEFRFIDNQQKYTIELDKTSNKRTIRITKGNKWKNLSGAK